MNRVDYIRDPAVCDFVDWFSPLLTGDRLLKHSWEGKGPHSSVRLSSKHFKSIVGQTP